MVGVQESTTRNRSSSKLEFGQVIRQIESFESKDAHSSHKTCFSQATLIFHWTYAPTTTSCSLFSQRLFYFPICRQREAGKGLSDSRKMSRPNYAKILFQTTLPPFLGTSHVRCVKSTSLVIRVLGVRFPTVLYNAIETTRREATSKHRLVVKASTGIECLLF